MVGVNVALNIVLVNGVGSWSGMGVAGSALANVAARVLVLTSIVSIAWWKRYHAQTWGTIEMPPLYVPRPAWLSYP